MNREDIDSLVGGLAPVVATLVKAAVEPLVSRIKELESRPGYDDSSLREQTKTLFELRERDAVAVDNLAKSIPAPYDDSGLVDRLSKQLEALREQIPAAYDDAEIKGALVDAEMRLGAKQSEEIEAVLNRIKDARYDDTALRAEVDVLFQGVDAQLDHLRKQAPADGKPGADGRDALQLEVLPAIDEQKSYTRGTYAKHAGGLWRAFEQTSGMRGWECIVDGVASLTAEMHGKSLVVRAIQSSGTEAILHATLPVQTYKGVFAQGSDYEIGDTATWGGSVWHCNVTGTKALPGDGSKDWTQAVKKGRDYREPVKVERTQGPVKIGGAE